jgi:Ca2+-transporting ATPase
MRRPPHPPQENIFSQGLWQHIVWVGLLMGAVSLGMGLWAYLDGHHAWQTMVFNTLTLSQMGHVMAIHSGKESLFSVGLLYNKLLLGAVILTSGLQMLVIYNPFFQKIFETHALSLSELAISIALSTVVFWAVEVEKWWQRRQDAAAKA